MGARRDLDAMGREFSHANIQPEYRNITLFARTAWRMIKRTARVLVLPHTHPHNFRHWRATQMLTEDIPLNQFKATANKTD